MGGHKIGVIAANPTQSKHLETATLKACGIEIDIANLRAQEIYQEDSRIPTVRFGTPLEDSERRDFTINALFFNIHTKCVEDWTQRGMLDLFHGRIVTPLEPVQTFHDDPLRVLRAVRFAVRYQFDLADDLTEACRRTDIHQALHRKVSRERVGKELEGMLSGTAAKPIEALTTLSNLHLAGSVFALPVVGIDNVSAVEGHILKEAYENLDFNSNRARDLRQKGWVEAQRLLRLLPSVIESFHNSAPKTSFTVVDLRLLPLGVFLLPFRNLSFQERNKKEKSNSAIQYIVQQGIKFKNTDVKAMTTLQESVDSMAALLRKAAAAATTDVSNESKTNGSDEGAVSRLEAGLMLRACKDLWTTCLLLACVLVIGDEEEGNQQDQKGCASRWHNNCNLLLTKILEMDLDRCWKVIPLLDGKAVIRALDIPRGPQVGQFLEEQVRWMLQNPNGSKEQCESHLRGYKRQLENSTEVLLDGSVNAKGTSNQLLDGNGSQQFSKKGHREGSKSARYS